jgi:hypothetical protein
MPTFTIAALQETKALEGGMADPLMLKMVPSTKGSDALK